MLKSVVDVGVPIILVFGMTTVGLGLTAADFRQVVRRPWVVLMAVLVQTALLPTIGWILTRSLGLQPIVAAGLMLVAACPSGATANLYTQLARGDVALSVTLTAISCLTAGFTMPFVLAALKIDEIGAAEAIVPTKVLAIQLLALLVLPVVVGMSARRLWPAVAERHGRLLLRVGIATLVVLLGLVIVEQSERFADAFTEIASAASLLTVLTFGAGWLTGFATGCGPRSRFAVGMVFAVRNAGVATAVAVTALGRIEFAVFATAYFLSQFPILLCGALLFRPSRGGAPDGIPEVALQ
jgi:BASS family bile acid:Na+ symporter